jgi:predicted heme/steroid binding protein
MEKIMKKTALMISLMFILTACSNEVTEEVVVEETVVEDVKEVDPITGLEIDSADGLILFSLEDLAIYDGKQNEYAYVAVDGLVYDVSNDRKWRDGEHYDGMTAGKDLSAFISASPHGASILEDYEVIGKLID